VRIIDFPASELGEILYHVILGGAAVMSLPSEQLPSHFGDPVGLQIIGPSATCWDRGFADSPLEEAVMSEPVSVWKFPC
jgi:hypothetical protein